MNLAIYRLGLFVIIQEVCFRYAETLRYEIAAHAAYNKEVCNAKEIY